MFTANQTIAALYTHIAQTGFFTAVSGVQTSEGQMTISEVNGVAMVVSHSSPHVGVALRAIEIQAELLGLAI